MRQYKKTSSKPTQIAHQARTLKVSGAPKGTRRDILTQAKIAAAEVLVDAIKETSSRISTEVPDSVHYERKGQSVYILSSGPFAPSGYQMENATRHPLFGNRRHWYQMKFEPYIEWAVSGAGDKAAEAFADEIVKWADEIGEDRPAA